MVMMRHKMYPLENVLRRLSPFPVEGWEPFEVCRTLWADGGMKLVICSDDCVFPSGPLHPMAYVPSRPMMLVFSRSLEPIGLNVPYPSIVLDENYMVDESPSNLILPEAYDEGGRTILTRTARFIMTEMSDGTLKNIRTGDTYHLPKFSTAAELGVKLRLAGFPDCLL